MQFLNFFDCFQLIWLVTKKFFFWLYYDFHDNKYKKNSADIINFIINFILIIYLFWNRSIDITIKLTTKQDKVNTTNKHISISLTSDIHNNKYTQWNSTSETSDIYIKLKLYTTEIHTLYFSFLNNLTISSKKVKKFLR